MKKSKTKLVRVFSLFVAVAVMAISVIPAMAATSEDEAALLSVEGVGANVRYDFSSAPSDEVFKLGDTASVSNGVLAVKGWGDNPAGTTLEFGAPLASEGDSVNLSFDIKIDQGNNFTLLDGYVKDGAAKFAPGFRIKHSDDGDVKIMGYNYAEKAPQGIYTFGTWDHYDIHWQYKGVENGNELVGMSVYRNGKYFGGIIQTALDNSGLKKVALSTESSATAYIDNLRLVAGTNADIAEIKVEEARVLTGANVNVHLSDAVLNSAIIKENVIVKNGNGDTVSDYLVEPYEMGRANSHGFSISGLAAGSYTVAVKNMTGVHSGATNFDGVQNFTVSAPQGTSVLHNFDDSKGVAIKSIADGAEIKYVDEDKRGKVLKRSGKAWFYYELPAKTSGMVHFGYDVKTSGVTWSGIYALSTLAVEVGTGNHTDGTTVYGNNGNITADNWANGEWNHIDVRVTMLTETSANVEYWVNGKKVNAVKTATGLKSGFTGIEWGADDGTAYFDNLYVITDDYAQQVNLFAYSEKNLSEGADSLISVLLSDAVVNENITAENIVIKNEEGALQSGYSVAPLQDTQSRGFAIIKTSGFDAGTYTVSFADVKGATLGLEGSIPATFTVGKSSAVMYDFEDGKWPAGTTGNSNFSIIDSGDSSRGKVVQKLGDTTGWPEIPHTNVKEGTLLYGFDLKLTTGVTYLGMRLGDRTDGEKVFGFASTESGTGQIKFNDKLYGIADEWNHIDVKSTISNGTATVELWVNGVKCDGIVSNTSMTYGVSYFSYYTKGECYLDNLYFAVGANDDNLYAMISGGALYSKGSNDSITVILSDAVANAKLTAENVIIKNVEGTVQSGYKVTPAKANNASSYGFAISGLDSLAAGKYTVELSNIETEAFGFTSANAGEFRVYKSNNYDFNDGAVPSDGSWLISTPDELTVAGGKAAIWSEYAGRKGSLLYTTYWGTDIGVAALTPGLIKEGTVHLSFDLNVGSKFYLWALDEELFSTGNAKFSNEAVTNGSNVNYVLQVNGGKLTAHDLAYEVSDYNGNRDYAIDFSLETWHRIDVVAEMANANSNNIRFIVFCDGVQMSDYTGTIQGGIAGFKFNGTGEYGAAVDNVRLNVYKSEPEIMTVDCMEASVTGGTTEYMFAGYNYGDAAISASAIVGVKDNSILTSIKAEDVTIPANAPYKFTVTIPTPEAGTASAYLWNMSNIKPLN